MKKLLLTIAAGVLCQGIYAQEMNEKSLVFQTGRYVSKTPVDDYKGLVRQASSPTANKTTATGTSRWYSHWSAVNEITGQALENNLAVVPIWFDSTVRQRFSTGLGTINYSSVAQYIDPTRFPNYNDPFLWGTDVLMVTGTNAYKVDSVSITAAYVKEAARPTSIVDTLIISVAPSTGVYNLSPPQNAWVTNYIPAGKTNLYGHTILNVDSVNRAAFSDVSSVTRILWKVPLTDAMRTVPDPTTGNLTLNAFNFAVPNGGLNVPAGTGFSITATFKSGDTWVPNVDSVNKFHRFMPLSSSTGANTQMPYFYYDVLGTPYPASGFGMPATGWADRNASNLMFSFDTSAYYPSVVIEGINTTNFRYEFHDIAGFVSCANCVALTTENVVNTIDARAYPNPAAGDVHVPFKMTKAADVKVSLANVVGQVVKTQTLGNTAQGEAVFSVSDLTNGVYFYTVEANGQTKTGRVIVNH